MRRALDLEQLREVDVELPLGWGEQAFRRCLECNTRLELASVEELTDRVPETVRREQNRFFCCPRCRRAYWDGSHTRRMREALGRALDRAPAS